MGRSLFFSPYAQSFGSHLSDDKKVNYVCVPSITNLDFGLLKMVHGISTYEERMLWRIFMLSDKSYNMLIFLTSMCVDPAIIDYYISLMDANPSKIKKKLKMVHLGDAKRATSLTHKLLTRPLTIVQFIFPIFALASIILHFFDPKNAETAP